MERNKIVLFSSMVVFFIVTIILNNPALSQKMFYLSADAAYFKDPKNNTYLEFYYSVPETGITFSKNSGSDYTCHVLLNLEIFQEDTLWATKTWKIEKSIADTAEITKMNQFMDIIRYVVSDSGHYNFVLFARDLNNPTLNDSIKFDLDLNKFAGNELELSGVELASKIQRNRSDTKNSFLKNGYTVMPNPSLIFGEGAENLYYYFEIYNLIDHFSDNSYKVECSINDFSGSRIENLNIPTRTKTKKYNSAVEIGKIDVSTLPSGMFTLVCSIKDLDDRIAAIQKKKFFIYNPSVEKAVSETTDASNGAVLPLLEGMSDKELDHEFEVMQYIVDKGSKNFYKNLTNVNAKKEYIATIWKSAKKDDIMTPAAFRNQYLARVDYANKNLCNMFRDGWETDQGRVFILYGPPSDIERHRSDISTKPYVIWNYEQLEGGVFFVFFDRTGFKRYELIHSTKRGELQNPDWENMIKVAH